MDDTLALASPPPSWPRRALAWLTARAIVGFAAFVTGVRAQWTHSAPQALTTLYFANHRSHGDFVLIWATLPSTLREGTRPVAGEDYWLGSRLRSFIGRDVFRALMIRRDGVVGADPVQQMVDALTAGDSLIMFPEGTRNMGDEPLLPLKSGLFHVASRCPHARFVPVWIDNLHRVLPKGMLLPVPLACTVRFGAPIALADGEDKAAFLERARAALLDLRPEHDREGAE